MIVSYFAVSYLFINLGRRLADYNKLARGLEVLQARGYQMEKEFAVDMFPRTVHGNSPMTLHFYERCGFVKSHVIKNFFIDNYDHPMYEDGQ